MQDGARLRPPIGWLAIFLVVAIVSGAASGAGVALLLDGSDDDDDTPAAAVEQPGGDGGVSQEAIARVVAEALPSVVTIVIEGEPQVDEQGNTFEPISSGSGFIVDRAGFIVTNEHVVRQPGTLTVVLDNGELRPAMIVSHDAPFTDLAVIRIPSGGLRPLPIGDSATLVQGQTVIAIGSALFDYTNSVSSGIVSGLGRRYFREGVFMEDLIQTDAAINTGNSGGPLITLDGEVVGVVSNVVRSIGQFENIHGISFAISTRTMLPIVESIVRTGSFPRPYMGVEEREIDVLVARELGLPVSRGSLVTEVHSGSPAAQGGIEPGDILLRLGRADIHEDLTFLNALALVGPTDRVPVQLMRGNEVMEVTLQLVPR